MRTTFIKGDIHTVIQSISSKTIDCIYVNPPFGTTEAVWDTPLNWEFLFDECFRVLKERGCLIIHCSIPFTYDLIRIRKPKYHYIWKKDRSTNFFHARIQPLRLCEEILVYYDKQPTYNPQMTAGGGGKRTYLKKCQYYGNRSREDYVPKELPDGKYPTHLLDMPREMRGDGTRPISMIEFFVKTYTNPGDTILDLTCYNGITGRVAKSLDRAYIGVDLRIHSDWFHM